MPCQYETILLRKPGEEKHAHSLLGGKGCSCGAAAAETALQQILDLPALAKVRKGAMGSINWMVDWSIDWMID